MQITNYKKLSILLSIIAITFTYSIYQNSKINKIDLIAKDQNYDILEMPDFSVYSFENNSERLFSPSGNDGVEVNLFHFWATWCAPCIEELPKLNDLALSLESNNKFKLNLIAINDNPNQMNKFFLKLGPMAKNIQIFYTKDASLLDKFGTVRIPETFVFNQKYKLLKRYSGPQRWGISDFKKDFLKE
jgi:cytochrome c biogenesis protein CcmG/thiol:disulfide interchange protein DsbE